MDNLTEKISNSIQPGMKILDLGCGQGKQCHLFASKSAEVIGVDKKLPLETYFGVDFIESSIEDFVKTLNTEEKFDNIFLRNTIQFLDKEYVIKELLPTLQSHLAQNGKIALQTFSQEPNPPFDKPLTSLYTLEELMESLSPLKITHAQENNFIGNDLSGNQREFFTIDIIGEN